MRKTKTMALLLAAILVFTSGCSGKGDNTVITTAGEHETVTDAGTAAAIREVNTFPLSEEPIELTFFAVGSVMVEDFNTNLETVEYEKKTNVHINWEVVNSDVTSKLNLSLASGKYPDAYWNVNFNATQQLNYGEQGIFLRLNELIDKESYYVKQILEDRPDIREAITSPEGDIYSLFRTSGASHVENAQKMWVYKPWLDQLGMDIPSTTEEYYNMLVAFRDHDMNGNGDSSDEYPLIGSKDGSYADVSGFLMNPFILNDGGRRINIVDGKLQAAYVQPEWREGLRYLNRLYEEGLLAKESFVQDKSQLQSLTADSDHIVIGSTPAMYPGIFVSEAAVPDLYSDYVVIPPLRTENSEPVTPRYYSDITVGSFVITKDCKYPEIAMRWVDGFYSEEQTLLSTWGREGVEYEWVDETNIMGTKPSAKMLVTYTEPQNIFYKGLGPRYFTTEHRNSEVYEAGTLGTAMYEASLLYEPYFPEESMPQIIWPDASQTEQLANYETLITDYVKESTAAFIIGERSIEEDWDSYVNELETMGLEQYIKLYSDILGYN